MQNGKPRGGLKGVVIGVVIGAVLMFGLMIGLMFAAPTILSTGRETITAGFNSISTAIDGQHNASTNYPAPEPSPSPQTNESAPSRSNRPANPAITLERAIEIAYEDLAYRGINATFRSDSGISWERSQWVWELEFRTQGERMPIIEFYINADNGDIVKFEWDD